MTPTYQFPTLPLTPESRESMILHHRRLAYSLANRYHRRHESVQRLGLEDACAAAVVGLIEAVDRWDGCPESFTTYAGWWIRHHVQQACRNATAVAIPVKCVQGKEPFPFGVLTESFQEEIQSNVHPGTGHDWAHPPDERHHREEERAHAREVIRPAMGRLRKEDPRAYRALLHWAHHPTVHTAREGSFHTRLAVKLGVSRTRAGQIVYEGLKRLYHLVRMRRLAAERKRGGA